MSGLKCLGKSLKGAEKQVTVQAVRPCTTQTADAKKMPIGKKATVVDKPHKHRGSVGNRGSPHSDQPAPVRELVMSRVGASAAEELINTNATSGAGEPVCLAGREALHQDSLLSSTWTPPPSPPHSEGSVDKRRAAPPSEPFPQPEPHSKEEEQLENETKNKEEEEEDEEKEGAPLELMAEFLSSVMRRDLRLASRLCQMILVYEPENPEAIQFLPLIQQKVLEDQEKELGTDDEDDDDEGEEDDSGEDSDNSESCDEDDQSGGDEGSSHD